MEKIFISPNSPKEVTAHGQEKKEEKVNLQNFFLLQETSDVSRKENCPAPNHIGLGFWFIEGGEILLEKKLDRDQSLLFSQVRKW